MRTITTEHNIYKFNELTDNAKDNAKNNILSIHHDTDTFYEMIKEDLKYLFPNSDLDVQYSLSYCQGDGLNIYGEVDVEDIIYCVDTNAADGLFEKYKNYLPEDMAKDIIRYANDCGKIVLPENTRYCYCIADRCNVEADWEWELEYNEEENINNAALSKLNKLVSDMFTDLCGYWEKEGYDWFYEITDGKCADYELEFYEDGSIFY